MSRTSPITTHVLDTSAGRPAAQLAVTLQRRAAGEVWETLAERATNDDGRVADLLPAGSLHAEEVYRLIFAVGDYFAKQQTAAFYPTVTIEFQIASADQHYHVPLLLSPFGYSTYRGS